jgi:gluconolactonase
VCFNWYRTRVTIPERVGELDPTGATVVFEVTIDDYAEVWVDGELPLALGNTGGQVVVGFNAPNRVVLTRDARPGDSFQIAVFGINGPISASPSNYIWMRTATLDVYAAERARPTAEVSLEVEGSVPVAGPLERVAGGFEFTEGPLWARDGSLLFSSPNTNAIYRLADGAVTVFRSKSGYTGVDIGRYHQPGSNGLTLSPEGLLTICQHGNRRVIRVNPHGDITVLADSYEGRRLNSPNDLVYRSDGTLFFTDPPFGLPQPDEGELGFSGVYRVHDGEVSLLTRELEGPNGLAFSPDERWLYVGNWDFDRIVVMRYDSDTGEGSVFFDMTSPDAEDAIDGLKVAPDGVLYACGPGGIWVLSPDGEHLGTLRLPEAPHNLAWGGDGHDLYITALTSVYRLRLETKGATP